MSERRRHDLEQETVYSHLLDIVLILVEIGQEIGGRRDPCLSRKVPNESLRKCGLASPEVAIE